MRFLYILFFFSCLSIQSQNCDCAGFIDWQSDKMIPVYSDSNGQNEIAVLQNDVKNEDFLVFKILKNKANYFKVEIRREMDRNSITGWIKKIKEIATYDRNYSDSKPLNLYSKPDSSSKIKSQITEYHTDYYTIKSCESKWVYVQLEKDGQISDGWLEPEMQCPNPYTTCN